MYPWDRVDAPRDGVSIWPRNYSRDALVGVAAPVYALGVYDISFPRADGSVRTPWYWRHLEIRQVGSSGRVRFKASPATMVRPWAGMTLVACGYWYFRDHLF